MGRADLSIKRSWVLRKTSAMEWNEDWVSNVCRKTGGGDKKAQGSKPVGKRLGTKRAQNTRGNFLAGNCKWG